MRKIVKPAVKCQCCGQTTEYPVEQTFCDQCNTMLPKNMYPLIVDTAKSVDYHEPRAELCSWACVRKYLIANKKKIGKCWYVSLPMPIFKDTVSDKQYCDSGANFFKDFLLATSKQAEVKQK